MKAENWFQLRIVGVTAIIARLRPGFFNRNQSSPAMESALMQSEPRIDPERVRLMGF